MSPVASLRASAPSRLPRRAPGWAAACGLLLSVQAAARTEALFEVSTRWVPYASIDGGSVVGSSGAPSWSGHADDGYVEIPLPFDFAYAGESFRRIYVGTNGLAAFHLPRGCARGDCLPNASQPLPLPRARPGDARPRSVVAPFWMDLTVDPLFGAGVRSETTAEAVRIEWFDALPYTSVRDAGWVPPFRVTMSLTLTRDGELVVHYGPVVVNEPADAGASPRSSIGFTGPSGAEGAALVALPGETCTLERQEGCCGASVRLDGGAEQPRLCAATDLAEGLSFSIRTRPLAELAVSAVAVAAVRQDEDGGVLVDYEATVVNRGPVAASRFEWRAYLSRDATLSTDDVLVDRGHLDGIDAGAEARVMRAAVSTRAGPRSRTHLVFVANPPLRPDGSVDVQALGDVVAPRLTAPVGEAAGAGGGALGDADGADDATWYGVDEAGTDRTVAEYAYADNVRASEAFSNGLDLKAVAVVGPHALPLGERGEAEIRLGSSGASLGAGVAVDVELRLSVDRTSDRGDLVLARRGVSAAGTGVVVERMDFTLPRALEPKDYWLVALVDPDGRLPEVSTLDNVAVAARPLTAQRAELVAKRLDAVDPATGQSLGLGSESPLRLGDAVELRVTVANSGTGPARDVAIAAVLSQDGALSLLADALLVERSVGQLAAGEERVIGLQVRLPDVARDGAPLPSGSYHLFALIDPRGAVLEGTAGNNLASSGPRTCVAPAADLEVRAVEVPATTAAGELLPVARSLANRGNRAVLAAVYGCFLSVNDIVTAQDVPLPRVGAPGEPEVLAAQLDLPAGAMDVRSELFRVPASVEPGTYFVGCLVDPMGTVPEMLEVNNAQVSGPLRVEPGALRVLTRSLPDAVVGRGYVVRLQAVGFAGRPRWSVDVSGGALPPGLVLGDDGVLTGTPGASDGAGPRAVTVLVQDGASVAAARLALLVREATVPLVVTTASLPLLSSRSGVPVAVALGATGGHVPYAWRLVGGRLPAGLALSREGRLEGVVAEDVAAGTFPFAAEVQDAAGLAARRELTLRVVTDDGLSIDARPLPEARVGTPYSVDVAVRRAAVDAVDRPFAWRVDGALPPGLGLEREADVAVIVGSPSRAGTYDFALEVEDARGRVDRRALALVVRASSLRIGGAVPEVLSLGATVDAALEAPGAEAPTFWVSHGRLPPGLALSPSGRLTGTVVGDIAVGTWPFAVQVRAADGASGLRAFGVAVAAPPPPASGCQALPAPGALAWLATAVGLLAARSRCGCRRRRLRCSTGPVALAALVALVAGGPAWAQGVPAPGARLPYAMHRSEGQSFAPLVGGRRLDVATREGARLALPFAFDFAGEARSTFVVSRHGYLTLPGNAADGARNQPVPHDSAAAPQALIAPWWDELTTGVVRWAVRGAAPRRVLVVEWSGVAPVKSPETRFGFQVQLFEATGQVRFSYAPGEPRESSASVGLMTALGAGQAALACAAEGRCDGPQYPSGAVIDFLRPPDFVVDAVALPAALVPGLPASIAVSVRNAGGRRGEGVLVRAFASSDALLDQGDRLVAEAVLASVDVGEAAAVRLSGPWPVFGLGVATDTSFAIAVVNPDGALAELRTDNNVSRPLPVALRGPSADLRVERVEAVESVAPGGRLEVRATVGNAGTAEAGAVAATLYLSENAAVTPADRALASLTSLSGGIAAGASRALQESIVLPDDLAPGAFWVGLCVELSGEGPRRADEPSWGDNCAAAPRPVIVETGELVIAPAELPEAARHGVYAVELTAPGFGGPAAFTIVDGALPPGLALLPSGALRGSPSRAGDFAFTASAERSGRSGRRSYLLRVGAGDAPLRIVDLQLPSPELGAPYRVGLAAVGGAPPYAWSLAEGALPPGLFLGGDGRIEGRAAAVEPARFTLRVVDSLGAVAQRVEGLVAVPPSRLTVIARAVASATLGERLGQPLAAAAGGTPPYRWIVSGVRRLDVRGGGARLTPSETVGLEGRSDGGTIAGEVPIESLGLGVDPDSGWLRGVPVRTGRFELSLAVRDAAGSEDVARVAVVVGAPELLSLETLALPDALLTVPYSARLVARGASREGAVRFALACVEASERPEGPRCDEGAGDRRLPEGLVLREGGLVEGTPASRVGVHAFWVRLTDGSGREDVQPLAIHVREAPSAASCAATDAGTAAPWLALALLAVGRRGGRGVREGRGGRPRDRRLARAWGGLRPLSAALSVALCQACTEDGERGRCEARAEPCGAGQTCDPADGLCKCGGAGGVACPEGFACDLPARTCVSERCRGVDCRSHPGTGCDALTGQCACGGTGGPVCRDDERCEPELRRCLASGGDGAPCGEGEERSSETGRCRCGLADGCQGGQRCSGEADGGRRCVDDRCAGVRCTGGFVCDPADGLCACNGARCASGELCDCVGAVDAGSCAPEQRACVASDRCAGVDCGSDSLLTCDPSDGVCKCGGPGGTRCEVGQRCRLLPTPRCEGGARCALADGGALACRDGLSCDPEDGVCKCGGRGGTICREATPLATGGARARAAELCVTSDGQAQCREPCDLQVAVRSSGACPEGAACYLDASGPRLVTYCATSGALRPEGAACTSPTACGRTGTDGLAQALHCAGLGALSATGVCRAYCDVASGPGGCDQSTGARVCVPLGDAPRRLGTCLTP